MRGVRGRVGCIVRSPRSFQTHGRPELEFWQSEGGRSAFCDVDRWKKQKTTNHNYEGPVGMVNTNTFQEIEKSNKKNNSSLFKKKKKSLAGCLAEKKILICPSTFHFQHEQHLFCFPSLPFGLTKPYLFLLDRGYDLEIVRHSVVNDLLEGAGGFTIFKWLAIAEGSLRYF